MSQRHITRGFLCGSALLLTGCSAIPTQFGGTWPLPVERQSSAVIDLARPIVRKESGGYVIEGYLARQFGAVTTAHSHVDVQFLAEDGAVLREEAVDFVPRELPPRVRLPGPSARYEFHMPEAPAGTTRVRVIAHDEPHAAVKTAINDARRQMSSTQAK